MSDDQDTSTEAPERPARRHGSRAPAGSTSLAHIAQLADVSEATVSRVLNRKYGVSASTRRAVEEALRAVGYERPINNELVLLLTPNLRNPIFAQQADRIENELSPHGLKVIICQVYPGTPQERDYVKALMDSGVAAIVFLSSSNTLPNADHRVLELIKSRGIPYVSINGGFPEDDAPVVSTDDWLAAEVAVGHLHDLGHRRIGLIAGPVDNIPADRRVEGFVQAMDRRGVDRAEDLIVRHHFNYEGGEQGGATLLSQGATAIVASSDEMALGTFRAATRHGLKIPDEVSVIGYDDSALLDFTAPALTTVRQSTDRIAESVGRIVISLMGNREPPNAELFITPELHLRASTGPVSTAR